MQHRSTTRVEVIRPTLFATEMQLKDSTFLQRIICGNILSDYNGREEGPTPHSTAKIRITLHMHNTSHRVAYKTTSHQKRTIADCGKQCTSSCENEDDRNQRRLESNSATYIALPSQQ